MTTNVFNTKIKEVGNKILYLSGLVNKIDYDAKILEIEEKYFTTFDYNKFTIDILDAKINPKQLVYKSNTSNVAKNSDFNIKLQTLATKAELKSEQGKIMKLQAFIQVIFMVKILLVMMVLKICLFISQNLKS